MGAKKMKWWQESIKNLKGIGPKRIEAFNRLNVHTIGDLLNFYPRMDSYIDNSKDPDHQGAGHGWFPAAL
jgi:ATP-dependent DNA helicase RecG